MSTYTSRDGRSSAAQQEIVDLAAPQFALQANLGPVGVVQDVAGRRGRLSALEGRRNQEHRQLVARQHELTGRLPTRDEAGFADQRQGPILPGETVEIPEPRAGVSAQLGFEQVT